MPNKGTSSSCGIPYLLATIRRLNPRSVLDVGCGFGRYGFLIREFLEIWTEHRYEKSEWQVYLEGIDAYAGNWCPLHDYLYDRYVTSDIRSYPFERRFDLILAGDVIEHLPKAEAFDVLQKLESNADRVLVGIPLGDRWVQGELGGNPFQAHRSTWQTADFTQRYDVLSWETALDEFGRPYGMFLIRGKG